MTTEKFVQKLLSPPTISKSLLEPHLPPLLSKPLSHYEDDKPWSFMLLHTLFAVDAINPYCDLANNGIIESPKSVVISVNTFGAEANSKEYMKNLRFAIRHKLNRLQEANDIEVYAFNLLGLDEGDTEKVDPEIVELEYYHRPVLLLAGEQDVVYQRDVLDKVKGEGNTPEPNTITIKDGQEGLSTNSTSEAIGPNTALQDQSKGASEAKHFCPAALATATRAQMNGYCFPTLALANDTIIYFNTYASVAPNVARALHPCEILTFHKELMTELVAAEEAFGTTDSGFELPKHLNNRLHQRTEAMRGKLKRWQIYFTGLVPDLMHLTCLKFCFALTLIRHVNDLSKRETILIAEEDFNTAFSLTGILFEHTRLFLTLLPEHGRNRVMDNLESENKAVIQTSEKMPWKNKRVNFL